MVNARKGRVARDRNNPLQAYVTPDERKAVVERAAAVGMTLSAYIRAACLSRTVAAPADLGVVETLAKVNADQARLGNLLKLYLQDPDADRSMALRLIGQIDEGRAEIKAVLGRIRL